MTLTKQEQRDKEWRALNTKIEPAWKARDAIVRSAEKAYLVKEEELWKIYNANIKKINNQKEEV